MPTYHVTKTSNGGYWVTDSVAEDMVVGGMNAVGSVLGGLVGGIVEAVASGRLKAANEQYRQEVVQLSHLAGAEQWHALFIASSEFVRRHPNEIHGYDALALALLELRRPDEVLEVVRSMADRNVASADELARYRAAAFIQTSEMPSVLREVGTLVDNPSSEVRAFGLAARAQAMLWLGDLDQALADSSRAITESPDANNYVVRGDVHWARDELDDAARDYGYALRLEPDVDDWNAKLDALDSIRSGDQTGPGRATSPDAKETRAATGTIAIMLVRQRATGVDGGVSFGFKTAIFLKVDGHEVAELGAGETFQMEVEPGEHSVQVRSKRMTSEGLNVYLDPATSVMLECGYVTSFMMRRLVVREYGDSSPPFER